MSVSVPLLLLLHNRHLHLGLITPARVSESGLTCGTHPVWCSDSFTGANRRRAALTPSETFLLLAVLSEQSDLETHALKENFQTERLL